MAAEKIGGAIDAYAFTRSEVNRASGRLRRQPRHRARGFGVGRTTTIDPKEVGVVSVVAQSRALSPAGVRRGRLSVVGASRRPSRGRAAATVTFIRSPA